MNASADWASAGRRFRSGRIALTRTLQAATRPLEISSRRTTRLDTIGVTITAGRSDAIAMAVAIDGWRSATSAIRPRVIDAIHVIVRSRFGPLKPPTRLATHA